MTLFFKVVNTFKVELGTLSACLNCTQTPKLAYNLEALSWKECFLWKWCQGRIKVVYQTEVFHANEELGSQQQQPRLAQSRCWLSVTWTSLPCWKVGLLLPLTWIVQCWTRAPRSQDHRHRLFYLMTSGTIYAFTRCLVEFRSFFVVILPPMPWALPFFLSLCHSSSLLFPILACLAFIPQTWPKIP